MMALARIRKDWLAVPPRMHLAELLYALVSISWLSSDSHESRCLYSTGPDFSVYIADNVVALALAKQSPPM